MAAAAVPVGRIFLVTSTDPKEKLEEELELHGQLVKGIAGNLSAQDVHDALTSAANISNEKHEQVCVGLLYIILTEPDLAGRAFQDLALITRDHFSIILTKCNIIIIEKYFKLLDVARQQLVWFIGQLVGAKCVGSNQSCVYLLKNIVGGDVSSKNVWLADKLLDIFIEHKALLLDADNIILCFFVYTYLRLICDHRAPKFESMRSKEIKFCVSLLREKFVDCCLLGRDLIRLLLSVARIPEFEAIWKDIIHRPFALSPKFAGLTSLLQTRTQRKFIAARLTMEMETKLSFLLSKVKFGNHKRYQEWFQKSYLSTAESQTLCPDLIRYICCVIHPTNEILSSDIIPRWAVIGWLLLQCKSNSIAAECKLALFFDWLTFHPERDNIMNIEPAVLVMYHNLKHHPATSITLLDFLCRIQSKFYPNSEQVIRQGIHNAFKLLLDKRVLPSLAPIFESNKLDPDLKVLIKSNFSDFLSPDLSVVGPPAQVVVPPPPPPTTDRTVTEAIVDLSADDSGLDDKEPVELPSDSEEELTVDERPSAQGTSAAAISSLLEEVTDVRSKPTKELLVYPVIESVPTEDVNKYLSQLEPEIAETVKQLKSNNLVNSNPVSAYNLVERIADTVVSSENVERDAFQPLASCLVTLLAANLQVPVMSTPDDNTLVKEEPEAQLQALFAKPLYALFKVMCANFNDTQPLSNLVAEMYDICPRIGYQMLLFLSSSPDASSRYSIYGDIVLALEDEIPNSLVKDMALCAQHDMKLFLILVPFLFTNFSEDVMGQVQMTRLIVSVIDPSQLNHLLNLIMLDELEMFENESLTNILNQSLSWETYEQLFLWQLIAAHELSTEFIVPVIHGLSWKDHPEPMSALLLRLKKEKPTQEILKHIYCRHPKLGAEKEDKFCTAVLYYWSVTCSPQLAELTRKVISGTTTPNQKSSSPASKLYPGKNNPTLTDILRHLDRLRQNVDYKSDSFFTQDAIKEGLKFAHLNIYKTQRSNFEDLFALASATDSGDSSKRNSRLKAKRKKSTSLSSDSASEEDTSPKRKLRKTTSRLKKEKTTSSSDSELSD